MVWTPSFLGGVEGLWFEAALRVWGQLSSALLGSSRPSPFAGSLAEGAFKTVAGALAGCDFRLRSENGSRNALKMAQAKARIWPSLAYVFQVGSTTDLLDLIKSTFEIITDPCGLDELGGNLGLLRLVLRGQIRTQAFQPLVRRLIWFSVSGFGFRVSGLGFRVSGLGFRV